MSTFLILSFIALCIIIVKKEKAQKTREESEITEPENQSHY